jgi:threonine dehydrogenase-like Zn-dependent dehydrogenase
MKAAIYYGVGDVRVEEVPDPQPGPKDIVVEVVFAGICGTDISEYNIKNVGALMPGRRFGHELSGIVRRVGKDVKNIYEGMRVTVEPILATRGGRRESCMLGGFSQYVLVQDTAIGYNVYPLPEAATFIDGALVEPFSVGMHGVNTVAPKPGDRALVLGAGAIGLSALAGLKALGVEDVLVSDISSFRLEKALQMGASAVHNPKQETMQSFLTARYGASKPQSGAIDIVIDGAGVGSALLDAIDVARQDARIGIIALHKSPIAINPYIIMSKTLTIKGSMGYTGEFAQVLGFRESGKADLRPIVTQTYPLEEINVALKTAAKVDEAIKVVISVAKDY